MTSTHQDPRLPPPSVPVTDSAQAVQRREGEVHRGIRAVIFDLDGVIVSTDEYHYLGWKRLADEEGIPFDRRDNERCRGVSRMESLEVVIERSPRRYSDAQKRAMADRKNRYYMQMLRERLSPASILPGAMAFMEALKARRIKLAIGSSSRNSPGILKSIGLADYFDATADGNDISRSTPDPEVFLLAARRLGGAPEECLVVEDAEAGVSAALAGGMKVLAVGSASGDPRAHFRAAALEGLDPTRLLQSSS